VADLERKATFIAQATGGDVAGREADDIADTPLTAEVKALATGNPLITEKAAVDAEVARPTRPRHAHTDEQRRLREALEAAHRPALVDARLVEDDEASQRADDGSVRSGASPMRAGAAGAVGEVPRAMMRVSWVAIAPSPGVRIRVIHRRRASRSTSSRPEP
jgi:hypothetical protein